MSSWDSVSVSPTVLYKIRFLLLKVAVYAAGAGGEIHDQTDFRNCTHYIPWNHNLHSIFVHETSVD